MRNILTVLIALFLLAGCGGGSSSDNQLSSEVTYSGADVSAVTDSRGKITVTSAVLGIVYEIAILNGDGQPVSGIELTYSESGGKSVVYITDSSGEYADVMMIGIPSELSAQFPRSKKTSYRSERATSYNLGVTLKQSDGSPTGFTADAENLNSSFLGTSERTGTGWSTVCATSSQISDTLSSTGGSKILLFSGLTADSSLYMKTGSTWSGDALTAAITQKLGKVFGMSFSNAFLASYQITCYAPDGGIGGVGAVCEITKSNDVCQTTPGGDETNTAPVINGTPSTTAAAGTSYSFTPSAADADGDTLTYSISNKPSWADFDTSTGALTGTTTAGVFSNIVISVTDGTDTASLTAFTITVESVVNNAPKISGTPSTGLYVNQTYDFTPSATDADGDDLNFTIQNKPSWAVFNQTTGRLSGTAAVGTFSNIVISVSDGQTSASLSSFTITVSNRAPVISGTPQTSASLGSAYSFKPAAYDLDGQTLSYSITNRPGWANFDETTGELSGTTTAGIYTDIVISVSDGIETVSLASFSISIASTNHAPTITGTPTASLYVKTAYSFTPTADDADGDTLTFGVLNKPDWASFDTSTGELSGAPTDNILYDGIVIYVSDGKSTTFLESFGITGLNHAPTISGTMPRYRWNLYLPFTSVFTASDADGDTLTFSLQNQPSGMVINSTTGQLSFYGSAPGTFENIMVTVSDGRTGGVATIGPFTVDVLKWAYTKTGAAVSYLDFDDKYYDKGFEPDYTRDDSTGIVTDNLNGIMWQDDAEVNNFTIFDANSYCSNLVLGGYDDWFLPDIVPFSTIMDYSRSPAVNSIFQNFDVSGRYWTLFASVVTGSGMFLNVNDAYSLPFPLNNVKCSRYSQTGYTAPIYKRDHNTRIVDAKGTMLQWDDDTTSAQVATWSNAVAYCENKTLNGLTDWRLPNIKEMISLFEYPNELNSEFVNYAAVAYWTSTTDAEDTDKAWYFNISAGTVATTAKTGNQNIKCVRGGYPE
ncbi:putative Ig domain-containing protein [Seleniivibrio sp.]|uniref:Lcl C-terminal domain-containing protein n=1 Tax=Seleniivibrio sp. TaxID=2898801 RepID=UPI0025DF4E02|nr:putative Ig domain-containing protein [Seleniivibrio sp.]MCD8552382.1 DUF1566 domain-containing protein [Seleniivibrio sp.]